MGLFFLTLLTLSEPTAYAANDPNLSREGNKWIVKREACLTHGGSVESDKRYYICSGGKYDGYITEGPQEPEGDEEEVGHP